VNSQTAVKLYSTTILQDLNIIWINLDIAMDAVDYFIDLSSDNMLIYILHYDIFLPHFLFWASLLILEENTV